MIGLRFLVGLAIAAGLLPAADLQLSGPVTGVVFIPVTRSLRPIVGYPGAAYIGPSILTGVDWAAVSPAGDRALVRGPEGLSLFEGLRSGSPRSRQVSQPAGEVMAAWSPDSNSLAIVYRQEQQLRVLDFDKPAERETEIPTGDVRGVAISDHSDLVLVAVAGEEGAAVWQFGPDQPRRIPLAGFPASVSFTRDGKDALILDQSGTRFYWIQDLRGAATVAPVTFLDNQEAAIFSIADAGSGRVLALDRGRRRAWLVDLASGRFDAEAQLDWSPESVIPLAQPFVFAAGGGTNTGDPVYVLSTRGRLDALFVPNTRE